MRRIVIRRIIISIRGIIFILLISLFINCGKTNTENNPAEQNEIIKKTVKNALNDWVNMWNSYDLDQVNKLFVPDSTLTYFSSEKEGIIRGIRTVMEHHAGFGFVSGGKKQDNKLWIEDVSIDIFGSTAVVTGIWLFKKGIKNDIKPQRGPVSFVYRKIKSRYLIAHVNFGNYE